MFTGGPCAKPLSLMRRKRFTPLNAEEVTSWWNAKDLNAGAVQNWASRVGARVLTQATVDSQPVASANAEGTGKWGVTFDGVADHLRIEEAWMCAAGSASVFAVVSSVNPATGRYLISEGSTVSNTPQYSPLRSNPSTATTASSQFVNDAGTTLLGNAPLAALSYQSTPQILVRIDNGLTMQARKNGVDGNSAAYTRGVTTLDVFTLGALARATPASFFPGTVHEWFAFLGTPSADEINLLEGYLAWEWQIPLAAGHPYELGPP